MKLKKLVPWLPGIATVLVAVVFSVIYAVNDGSKSTKYIELIGAGLLPFLFPVFGLVTKKPLPFPLSVLVAVFIFFANALGSLGFYDTILCWDVIMHGVFGFFCSLIAFAFLIRWGGSRMSPLGCMIIVFAFTLGVGALWEIGEYLYDLVTGSDAQQIAQSVALGKSPVADTMEDLIIAVAGIAVFYLALFADKFNRYRVFRLLCGFEGFEKPEKSEKSEKKEDEKP